MNKFSYVHIAFNSSRQYHLRKISETNKKSEKERLMTNAFSNPFLIISPKNIKQKNHLRITSQVSRIFNFHFNG